MSAVIEAKRAMAELGTKAQEVANDSSLSNAEKLSRLEKYDTDLKGYSETVAIHERAQRFMDGGEAAPEAKSTEDRRFKSFGEQITESDSFRSAQGIRAKSGKFSFSFEVGQKVAATVAEGTTIANGQLNGNAGVLALPDYLPGIVDLRYAPISVGQLFAQGATDSPIVSYVKEATETQGVAATSEATLKGQADATFARVNEQVGKVAGFLKMTDEMLQDVPQAESFLSNRLIAQVGREEENEVLNGSGYPALSGILGRAGLQTAISAGTTGTLAAPMKLAEAIFQQRTAIRVNSWVEPDAIIINPTDWQYLRLAKDGQSQYYAGGPFTGAYGNNPIPNLDSLWGLRVVQTPRIASGTVLVGAFQEGGQFFRKQGVTVEMANQNVDDFQNNLITVRAESRSALAIYRPGAFGKVTITWA